jgi:hypothetical protein
MDEWDNDSPRLTAKAPDAPKTLEEVYAGDLRPLVEHFANCFTALRNCAVRPGYGDAIANMWADRLAALAREHLPSGSGFDNGTTLDLDASRLDRLIFATAFHHMDDNGSYCGWTEHRVVVSPSFVGIELKVTGRDKRGIKDYIGEVFADMLRAPVRLSDLNE